MSKQKQTISFSSNGPFSNSNSSDLIEKLCKDAENGNTDSLENLQQDAIIHLDRFLLIQPYNTAFNSYEYDYAEEYKNKIISLVGEDIFDS